MSKPTHLRFSDLRGIQSLATGTVAGLTGLVEAMHRTIAATPNIAGASPTGPTTGITGLVYKSIRGVNRAVGASLDLLLGACGEFVADRPSSQEREAVLAALNGVFGDYLLQTGNPLTIRMRLRTAGEAIEIARAALLARFPDPGRNVVVLAHGLCMNDLQWRRDDHDHGAALARDLGFVPVYLHYNSGLHLADNGREFAGLMESFIREWPHRIDRLAIVGHSMGGLVARSALHHAAIEGHTWPQRLDDLVFLGTPHFGAPLAQAGAWVDSLLEISPYTAPFALLGNVRSAGLKDLLHPDLQDDDCRSLAVRRHAIAASRQQRPGTGSRIAGDGLVTINSALGRHRDPARALPIAEAHRWIGYGMNHFDLLGRAEVYARINAWLGAPMAAAARRSPSLPR